MINPIRYKNRIVISSIELYNALGKEHRKYYSWVRNNIIFPQSLESPADYFLHENAKPGIHGQRREYYLSPTLAKSLCINEGTIVAKNVKKCIETQVENKICTSPCKLQA